MNRTHRFDKDGCIVNRPHPSFFDSLSITSITIEREPPSAVFGTLYLEKPRESLRSCKKREIFSTSQKRGVEEKNATFWERVGVTINEKCTSTWQHLSEST
jgi:hypothetical protein